MRESRFIRENHGVRIREAETYRAQRAYGVHPSRLPGELVNS
jgi:hypothetical protein